MIRKNTRKFGKNWISIALLLAIVSVGWYAYMSNQARMISEQAGSRAWLNQQVQIHKLKACLDGGIKPCDINPKLAE